jgi:NCAIR mutase (PurE)-related protein
MDAARLRELLEAVRAGGVEVDSALESLSALPYRDLGFASVDHHRALRNGIPEVIFGERKTAAQDRGHRAGDGARRAQRARHAPRRGEGGGDRRAEPRHLLGHGAHAARRSCEPLALRDAAYVAVVTAGTSDMPVAEEAAETLSAVGLAPERYYDVGVAGIPPLFHRLDLLRKAAVGDRGARAWRARSRASSGAWSRRRSSRCPPRSATARRSRGFTALFAMLTSCASGVAVVNIDSGFGAAMVVHRMLLDGTARVSRDERDPITHHARSRHPHEHDHGHPHPHEHAARAGHEHVQARRTPPFTRRGPRTHAGEHEHPARTPLLAAGRGRGR